MLLVWAVHFELNTPWKQGTYLCGVPKYEEPMSSAALPPEKVSVIVSAAHMKRLFMVCTFHIIHCESSDFLTSI